MAKLGVSASSVTSWLNVLREVDVRAIRAAAETPFTLAVVCRDRGMAKHVARLLNVGPRDYDVPSALAVLPFVLSEAAQATSADLVVIIARADEGSEVEVKLCRALESAKVTRAVVLVGPEPPSTEVLRLWYPAKPAHVVNPGVVNDRELTARIVNACLANEELEAVRVARHVPAFRDAVGRRLVAETSNTNAAYSVTTGLLEINPVATVPLGVTDTIVLTKNQAIMAYKIALAFGMPADFKHIMPQLAGVVGGAFVFRTIARTLIGLVPGLGIIPKTAIAYAGTVAMGEAIQRWCATGEQMSAEVVSRAYQSALERGRGLAHELRAMLPGRKRTHAIERQPPSPPPLQ